jgi:hypothetical protein
LSATTPPMGPGALPAADAARRYIDAVRADLEPDPLFRRRLRGTVLNQFVAEREGTAWPDLPRRDRMGALGRACLYASLATALSVTGVMAASEAAVPGDLLYPLKLSIEEMRVHVAPGHLRDELATYELAERIDELGRLAESGDLARATELASNVGLTYERLTSTGADPRSGPVALEAHLTRLREVLERVPVEARRAIERAMSLAPGFRAAVEDRGRQGHSTDGSPESNASESASGPQDAEAGSRAPERTQKPKPTAEPTTTPQPTATAEPAAAPEPGRPERPEPSAKPERSPKPDPSSRPDHTRRSTPARP